MGEETAIAPLVVPEAVIDRILSRGAKPGTLDRMRVALERLSRERAWKCHPLDDVAKDAFLGAITAGMAVDYAADIAGVAVSTVYAERQKDPVFAKRWADAQDASVGELERSAEEIAFEGDINSMARVNALKLLLGGRSARYSQRPPAAAPMSAELSANGQTIRFVSGSALPD
jgi:hypothetical protein